MTMVLSALDRCDRCGAQAYVQVTLESDTELFFCAHHWKEHGDKISEIAKQIHDETERLAAPAASST